jgi:ACR3 family arsenite efflux pump ArsB
VGCDHHDGFRHKLAGARQERQPLVIALLTVPIVIQVYLNAGIAYMLNHALGVPHNIACPSALIGVSNFFELAVAAAIALFGFQSGRRSPPSSASWSKCRSCCRSCASC